MTEELAAKFQAALDDSAGRDEMAGGGGMTATVMTAGGTWSGTTGSADGVRNLHVDDQFAIASITKSVIAAQVMLIVEAGELGLDDLAAPTAPSGRETKVKTRLRWAVVMALSLGLAGCGSEADRASTTSTTTAPTTPATTIPVESTVAPPASTTPPVPEEPAASFPVETFAAIGEDPVTAELAAALQAALEESAGRAELSDGGGLTATVMTADGTWSAATGAADGVRDLQVDNQFAIASITKSIVATQVMLMVEAGELDLDDLATDHLPGDLGFDTNGATIRHLLSHRSGLPDDWEVLRGPLQSDPLRVWTPADVFELIPTRRAPLGNWEYSGINYLLLGLVIEHIRGHPVAEVLRDGALAVEGLERLIYQPDEQPTEPIAMPGGRSTTLETLGGYLPSLAVATAIPSAGAMASDAPSLARWWRALCAGEIVSQASLTEMAALYPDVDDDGYGLGLGNPAWPYTRGTVGHGGELFGDLTWAACLPEEEAVIVVLSNRPAKYLNVDLVLGMLRPFVDVLRSG